MLNNNNKVEMILHSAFIDEYIQLIEQFLIPDKLELTKISPRKNFTQYFDGIRNIFDKNELKAIPVLKFDNSIRKIYEILIDFYECCRNIELSPEQLEKKIIGENIIKRLKKYSKDL